MLSVRNLVKTYQTTKSKKKNRFKALDNVSIDFPENGLVFILGKSGSGKSTLLNSIGGLDTFDSGEIIIKGKSSKEFSGSDFDSYRNTFVGFIFQDYNIIENFNVAKNLAFAIELQGLKADKQTVMSLLEKVDLQGYAKRKPNQLSGGQKQRVAIARALIKNPEIIMADEPTGALDSATGKQVMETLKELSKRKLIIVVSHDREFAETYGDRIIELKDGKIISDETKKEVIASKTENGVSVVDGEYIHIKQGQQLGTKDLSFIAQKIIENNKGSDTIITFGEKSNKKVKKLVNINDVGNQEVFSQTLPGDIKTDNYEGRQLRLIKSRLKWSDSFKIGASALKYKVGKLIFTIFLAVFAFTCFGIIDAFASWNRIDSINDAINITNPSSISLKKRIKGDYSFANMPISEQDVNNFKTNFSDYEFNPVCSLGKETLIDVPGLTIDSNLYSYYGCYVYGFMNIKDEDNLNNLKLSLTGNLPINDNEVCISKHLFECLKNSNNQITNFDIIKDAYITFDGVSDTFKIVGMIDDGSDYSKYKDIKSETVNSNNYMQIESMQNDLNYGHARMIYTTDNVLQQLLYKGTSDTEFQIYCGNQSMYWFSRDVVSENYIKKNSLQLNDNEIILYYWEIQNDLGCDSIGELKKLIDEGLTIKAYNRRSPYEEICTLTVVGFVGDSYYITNQNTKEFLETASSTIELKTQSGEYISRFNTNEVKTFDSYISYNKNTNNELKKNQIILPKDNLLDIYSNQEEIITAINNGLQVRLGTYGGLTLKEFDVVGITSFDEPIFSQDTYNELNSLLFHGYSHIITGLQDGDNSKLIKYCESENNGVYFNILNDATSVLDMFGEIISSVTQYFIYVAIGFAVFAALIFMNYISTSISYKKREIGILRALGARSKDVFGIFFNESLIIALINFLISSVLTFILCIVINSVVVSGLGISLTLLHASARQFVLIFAISVVSAFVSSLIPVNKISKKKPIDAINNR